MHHYAPNQKTKTHAIEVSNLPKTLKGLIKPQRKSDNSVSHFFELNFNPQPNPFPLSLLYYTQNNRNNTTPHNTTHTRNTGKIYRKFM
jgi:hypothetical protein